MKPVASEGDAVAGKEGFGKDMEWKWVGMGRGPARLRSSSGWAGGFFALRVTRRGRLDTGGLDDRMIG